MILTKHWVYLDLQKTGCTFLREKLLEIFPQIRESQFTLKLKRKLHKTFPFMPPPNTQKHRRCQKFHNGLRLMTIRDPFDYYYSLWSYGIDGRGAFYDKLKGKLSPINLAEIYGERSASCFQNFLNQAIPGGELDLYTKRVLNMILPKSESKLLECLLRKKTLLSPDFCHDNLSQYYPSVLLPTDALADYFHLMADNGKLSEMNLPSGWKNIFPLGSKKINASVYGSDLNMKQIIRQQCSDSVDLIYSNCFLPNSLYKLSKNT